MARGGAWSRMLLRRSFIQQITFRHSTSFPHPHSINTYSTVSQKTVWKIPFSMENTLKHAVYSNVYNGWNHFNTKSFASGRLADIDEMLAELEKEIQREKTEKKEKKIRESSEENVEEEEEEEEEEDYMRIGKIPELPPEKEGEEDRYDDDWQDDEDEDEHDRFSLKAQKKRKEDFDKTFSKYEELLKNFCKAGTFDDAYKLIDRIERFEAKHFPLTAEYKVVGYLLNQLKEATGKERFILLMKANRALKQLEWKVLFDPENPENYGIIKQDDGGTGEDLEHGGYDQEKRLIEGQTAADTDDAEDSDEEKDKDEILADKLRVLDKEIKKKFEEMGLAFGKQARDLEEEIRELVERREALTERRKPALYRKGFDAKLIDVNRTCKVTKGGQVISYTAMVVCGNFNGVVGYAKGKGPAVPVALKRAYEKSFQNLHYIERYEEHTIAHAIQTKFKKTKIYLWPAAIGTGMKANSTVESVLYLAGLKNVKTKVIGSRHPHNTVKALFKALNMIETPQDIQEKFGRSVVESHLLK
eukprot:Gb_41243 [translate_table: standard]